MTALLAWLFVAAVLVLLWWLLEGRPPRVEPMLAFCWDCGRPVRRVTGYAWVHVQAPVEDHAAIPSFLRRLR